MKKSAIIAALMISTSLSATSAFAQSFNLDLSGDITDTTCAAIIDKSSINLGILNKSDFSNAGSKKEVGQFYIAVKDCPSIMKSATVTISGFSDVNNSQLFALDGDVSGLGIQITSSNQIIAPDVPKVLELQNGQANFSYHVGYVSTVASDEIQAGKAHTALNIDVAYQ